MTRDARAQLHAVHAVLMSSDLETSLRFFERPGFHEQLRDSPVEARCACLARDGGKMLEVR